MSPVTLLVRCAELNCCSHPVNGVCTDPVVTSGRQVPKDPFGPNIGDPGPRSLGVPLPLTVPGLRLEKEGRVWASSWHPHSCFAQLPVGSGARPGLPPISAHGAPWSHSPCLSWRRMELQRRISQLSPTGSKGALQKGTLHLHDHCSCVQVPPLTLAASGQYSQWPSVTLTPPAVGQTHLPCIPQLQGHVPRFP